VDMLASNRWKRCQRERVLRFYQKRNCILGALPLCSRSSFPCIERLVLELDGERRRSIKRTKRIQEETLGDASRLCSLTVTLDFRRLCIIKDMPPNLECLCVRTVSSHSRDAQFSEL
jgi:hypothetical protein